MSSNRFVTPVSILPEPSAYLAILVVGAHLSAMALLPLLNLVLGAKIVLVGVIALSLTWILSVHIFQVSKKAIKAFLWQSSGVMIIKDGRGDEHLVKLGSGIFVHPKLIILNFYETDGYRRSLLLFADSADPESLRRLRLRLLLTVGEPHNFG